MWAKVITKGGEVAGALKRAGVKPPPRGGLTYAVNQIKAERLQMQLCQSAEIVVITLGMPILHYKQDQIIYTEASDKA